MDKYDDQDENYKDYEYENDYFQYDYNYDDDYDMTNYQYDHEPDYENLSDEEEYNFNQQEQMSQFQNYKLTQPDSDYQQQNSNNSNSEEQRNQIQTITLLQNLRQKQQTLPQKKDDLFDIRTYLSSINMVPMNQVQKIEYLINQIEINDINFGTMIQDQGIMTLFKENQVMSTNAILRIRKQVDIGGIIEILFKGIYPRGSYSTKQLKIQIRVSHINEILFFYNDSISCLLFEGPPEFFVNSHVDTRPEHKRTINNDIKLGPKRWERIENLALSKIGQKDMIIKYLNIKNGCFSFKNNSMFQHSANRIRSTLIQLQKKPMRNVPNKILTITKNIQQLTKSYSIQWMAKKLEPLENIQKFKSFQIGFTLLSFLFECHYVNLKQVQETIDSIVKIIKLLNHQQALEGLNKMTNVLTNINKSELFIKMQNGMKLHKIFQKKYLKINKISKKMPKQNIVTQRKKENIHVKAVKITPSGLIPAGWNTDVRNRLLRHFRANDFQFMKIQVTNDDDARSILRGGGSILSKILRKMFSSVKIFNHQFIPIGWTQSQLKSSALWFTYDSKNPKAQQLGIIERAQLIQFLGKFDNIKNPALKAARIGQNLSTSKSLNLGKINVIYAKDDFAGKYKYTDGIGKISADLVKKIQTELDIPGTVFQIRYLGIKGLVILNRNLSPNTICVRQSMVKFSCPHPDADKYFDVLDFNYYKPGFLNHQILVLLDANGVPRQNIKSIQREYIKNLLEQGLNFQEHLKTGQGNNDIVNSFKQKNFNILERDKRKIDNISEVIKYYTSNWQIQIFSEPTLRGIMIEKYYNKLQRLVKKTHIKVQKSARILGIIDDYNILQENQVYCTILKDESNGELSTKNMKRKIKQLFKKMNGLGEEEDIIEKSEKNSVNQNLKRLKLINFNKLSKAERKLLKKIQQQKFKLKRENISGLVMVTRNPCMHPADIRLLKCVSKQQASKRFNVKYGSKNYFEEMPNCLIFPKAGSIPITAQISGSDLDGDNFFITWDQRLLPKKSLHPFITDDEYIPDRHWGGDSFNEIIEFFCEFIFNNKLGRLSNAHLSIADREGAFSQKCIKLCKIHNRAVDYPKKGYNFEYEKQLWVKQFPHFMEKQKTKVTYKSKSILGELYDQASSYYQQFVEKSKQNKYNLDHIQAYMGLEPEFTQLQFKQTCETVLQFNREIDRLMQIYGLERQFEVYNLKISYRTKQSRTKVNFIDEIKIKYFTQFLKKLEIDDPFHYIYELKTKKKVIDIKVLRKFILWYLVSHIELLKMDKDNKKEIRWFEIARKYLKGTVVKNIGLCWFCIPFITYQVLSLIKLSYQQKIKRANEKKKMIE